MDDKHIKPNKTLNYSRSKHKLETMNKVKTARPKKMFEEAILRDMNRVTTYDPFDRLPFLKYIAKKKIKQSPSVHSVRNLEVNKPLGLPRRV